MKSAGLAAMERKVSCSSAVSASFPFPLCCWPSEGPWEPVSFPGCWVKPNEQVLADLWIMVQSFLLLEGIKVTWAHVPAWAQSRCGAVSNTENRHVDVWIHPCVYAQGVFPDPTALWAVFPLTHLLHPQTSPSSYVPPVSTSLLPFQNVLKDLKRCVSSAVCWFSLCNPSETSAPSQFTLIEN